MKSKVSLKKKALLLSGVFLTLTVGLSGLLLKSNYDRTKGLETVYSLNMVPMESLFKMSNILKDIPFRMALYSMGELPAAGTRNKLVDDVKELGLLWKKVTKAYRAGKHDKKTDATYSKLNERLKSFQTFVPKLIKAYRRDNTETVLDILEEEWPVYQITLVKNATELGEYFRNSTLATYYEGKKAAKLNYFISIILSVISLGIVVYIGFYVKKRVVAPILICVEGIKKISRGVFEKIETVETNDEINGLAVAINQTVGVLKDLIGQTKKLVENLKQLPTPVMEIDREFNVVFMNDTGAKLVGFTPEECKGKKCFDLFKTTSCHTEGCAPMRAMRNGSVETDVTVARPQGAKIPITFTGKAVKDEEGEVVGAIEFIMDQTAIYEVIKRVALAADSMNNISHKLSGEATLTGSSSSELASQTAKVATSVEQVNIALSSMATASEQSNVNATSMATGAEEANASMKNIASAIEELNISFSEIATNTTAGSRVALEASTQAQEVNVAMNLLIEVSDRVSEVVEVIGSIASQTNMLALNATIEAARAGESGKGFAVVANEVKELSKQTANSSVDISNNIKDIQDAAQETKKKIEQINGIMVKLKEQSQNIAATVEEQTAIAMEISNVANDTVEAVNAMSTNAAEVCKGSEGVAKSTAETSLGMEEITKATTDVNLAGNDLAKNSQEVLKLSKEIAHMSVGFIEIISGFELLEQLQKE